MKWIDRSNVKRMGWGLLHLLLVAVILGLIAAMWTPMILQWKYPAGDSAPNTRTDPL